MYKVLALGLFLLPVKRHDAIRAAGSFVPWDWVIIFIIILSQKFILQINTTHCHTRRFRGFLRTYST